jgi:light-regulated signal transduction histidine kinase (bacteriophytochrome)
MLERRVSARTAALDAANRELEAFSYTVSHDLRSPLRQMTALAGLLRQELSGAAPPSSRELVDRILDSAAHMNELIEAMLELAHTAHAPLDLVDVNLNESLDRALAAVATDTAGRAIEWKRRPLPHALGDAVLVGQVLINLLSNAVKYTRGRSPAIIEIGQRSGRTEEVVIFVRDNGAGFDMRRAGDLFGEFRRMHDPAAFEGTGIGLATAHRIVTRHGGNIWADAAVDKGATFYFSLRRP